MHEWTVPMGEIVTRVELENAVDLDSRASACGRNPVCATLRWMAS